MSRPSPGGTSCGWWLKEQDDGYKQPTLTSSTGCLGSPKKAAWTPGRDSEKSPAPTCWEEPGRTAGAPHQCESWIPPWWGKDESLEEGPQYAGRSLSPSWACLRILLDEKDAMAGDKKDCPLRYLCPQGAGKHLIPLQRSPHGHREAVAPRGFEPRTFWYYLASVGLQTKV